MGLRIRRAREQRGWSQRDLARALGVEHAQISKWETGRNMPSPRYLERLGRELGVPAETFLLPGDG